MRYALQLDETNRILSACVVLPNGSYDDMSIVESLPDDDISDYRYADGAYVYDPLPEQEQPEVRPTQEERIAALEEAMSAIEEGIASV